MGDDELQCKILNCDETGFCIAIASKKMHETMGGSNKEYIKILACVCANGT